MALSLDDLKRKKVHVVKKNNDATTSPIEARQKIPPFRVDDSTRPDQKTISDQSTDASLNDFKSLSSSDVTSVGVSMDNFNNDDFREFAITDTKTSNKLVTNTHETSNKPDNKLVTVKIETSNKLVTENEFKPTLNNKDTKTSNKLVTNTHETSNKPDNKLVTVKIETSNKLVTENEFKPTLNNKDTKTSNKLVTNTHETSNTTHNKTSNKPPIFVTSLTNEKSDLDFNSLVGLKRQMLSYIFDRCYKNINLNKTNNTGPLTKEQLSEYTGKNANVIHVYLHRLIKDNLIIRVAAKEGRGGYSVFTLPQRIYQEILYSQGNETNNKLVTQLVTQLVTTPSSKIDSIYNNTNYLSGEEVGTKSAQSPPQQSAQILGWFKSLDFSAIPYIKPMMVNSAIRTLVETTLDPDDVQMFINKFKNWLVTQNRIQNPLAIFCDKLKEYANEGDSPVLVAMSDDEIHIELMMAQELKKRAEMDLINKARVYKQEQDREALFQEWFTSASDEEKKEMFKPQGFAEFGSAHYIAALKGTFLEKLG